MDINELALRLANTVTQALDILKKNGVGDEKKQLYKNRFKDCAVFSVCLEMTRREPPEFLTP